MRRALVCIGSATVCLWTAAKADPAAAPPAAMSTRLSRVMARLQDLAAERAKATANGSAGPLLPLRFVSEASYLPSREKAALGKAGEDAWFVSSYGVGVADGVGGWSEVGVDAGKYSRSLMAHADAYCRQAAGNPAIMQNVSGIDPLAALQQAYDATKEQGSSTACIATTGKGGSVRILNLGDSGAMVWRHSRPLQLGPPAPLSVAEAGKLWAELMRTVEQQHQFNTPAQLEASASSDKPRDGDAYTVPTMPGDLVILATDGLWDNLWEEDVRGVLAKLDFAPCHQYVRAMRTRALEQVAVERELRADGSQAGRVLEERKLLGIKPDVVTDAEVGNLERQCRGWLQSVATQLVAASQRVGADPVARSPFAVNAAKAVPSWRYKGGKMDDVAVVAALVVPDPSLVPDE